jgi:hypothetical protein
VALGDAVWVPGLGLPAGRMGRPPRLRPEGRAGSPLFARRPQPKLRTTKQRRRRNSRVRSGEWSGGKSRARSRAYSRACNVTATSRVVGRAPSRVLPRVSVPVTGRAAPPWAPQPPYGLRRGSTSPLIHQEQDRWPTCPPRIHSPELLPDATTRPTGCRWSPRDVLAELPIEVIQPTLRGVRGPQGRTPASAEDLTPPKES